MGSTSFGGKVVSWMAALANGAMVHQLDYDDCHDVGVVHPGGATVPAALAIAERQGNVTGKEFITAIALGTDTICRLSLPLIRDSTRYGWDRPGTLSKYGATVSASKLLGLDKSQIVSAFGIVLNESTISYESAHTGASDIRAFRDGFGAKAGILSALLAQKGVSGDKTSLDGRYGLYNQCWLGDSNPARVTAGLGKSFEGVNVSFKPWPCCRNVHGFVEATLRLVKEHDLGPGDIAKVVAVSGGERRGYYETMAERRRPQTSAAAKFSLPFVLGIAIARRNVLLEDFRAQGRSHPTALDLAQLVTYQFDEQYKRPGIEIGVIEIVTKTGKRYHTEVPFAYGHPKNPITKEDLFTKFKDCARYSIKPLTKPRVERVIEILDNLEKVEDMKEVVKLLASIPLRKRSM